MRGWSDWSGYHKYINWLPLLLDMNPDQNVGMIRRYHNYQNDRNYGWPSFYSLQGHTLGFQRIHAFFPARRGQMIMQSGCQMFYHCNHHTLMYRKSELSQKDISYLSLVHQEKFPNNPILSFVQPITDLHLRLVKNSDKWPVSRMGHLLNFPFIWPVLDALIL